MLDALVHGQDGDVAGAGQAPVADHLLQAAQHGDGTVGRGVDAVHEVRARQM